MFVFVFVDLNPVFDLQNSSRRANIKGKYRKEMRTLEASPSSYCVFQTFYIRQSFLSLKYRARYSGLLWEIGSEHLFGITGGIFGCHRGGSP